MVEGKFNVFVYGTLKQGYGNHPLLETSKFIGDGTTRGVYSMTCNGCYPTLTRSTDDAAGSVLGEVYEIDQETLEQLDLLEGVPHLYQRNTEVITLMNGETVGAFIYTSKQPRNGRQVLPDESGQIFWSK